MNKIKLFIEKEIQKEKYVYLKELYNSGDFKPEELLCFFSNNYLKHNHMPMLQGGRKKRNKKHKLIRRRLYNTLEQIIEDKIGLFTSSPFYNQFVDFRNINEGDTLWEKEKDTIQTNLKTRWEVPVCTLSRTTPPVGVNVDGVWGNVKAIPIIALRCTTRSLPAEATYRKIME